MKGQKYVFQIICTLILIVSYSASAEAGKPGSTEQCIGINSVPYSIITPGNYCLTGNLSTNITSGSAIEIATSNVSLDLNGYEINGQLGGPTTEANGIYAFQQKDITIRNGIVRNFRYGIMLIDDMPYNTSLSYVVEEMKVQTMTGTGISVSGRGIIIRNNQVLNTGPDPITGWGVGINAKGGGAQIINNYIYETLGSTADDYAIGIWISYAPDCVVENNRIGNFGNDSYISMGIRINASKDVLVVNNRITYMDYGIEYSITAIPSTGKYRDNLTSGVTSPYTGGTDAGGNN